MSRTNLGRVPRSLFALAALVLTIAVAVGIATPAKAITIDDPPSVMLDDMTNIQNTSFNVADGYELRDNYGNEYVTALYSRYSYMEQKYEYLLNGKYSRFTCTLYVPQGQTKDGTCTFSIQADGQIIYTSDSMSKSSQPVKVNVDVSGKNDVTLILSKGGPLLCLASAGFHIAGESQVSATPQTPAKGMPTVLLKDMRDLGKGQQMRSVDTLVDNYGTGYASAIGNRYTYLSYEMKYLLDGKYTNFTCTLYVPKGTTSTNAGRIYVRVDGREVYGSPIMTKQSRPVDVDVNVRGCKTIVIGISGDNLPLCLANAGFHGTASSGVAGIQMYRLYNPNSGEHFYTASVKERDSLDRVGWTYEGKAWVAPASSKTPVYRLYSGTDHHYCTSADERDALKAAGWKYEGIGWYSDDAKGVPLYRQFNPNVNPDAKTNNSGSHNYTTDKSENDALVKLGWKAEGIGWYGMK